MLLLKLQAIFMSLVICNKQKQTYHKTSKYASCGLHEAGNIMHSDSLILLQSLTNIQNFFKLRNGDALHGNST